MGSIFFAFYINPFLDVISFNVETFSTIQKFFLRYGYIQTKGVCTLINREANR